MCSGSFWECQGLGGGRRLEPERAGGLRSHEVWGTGALSYCRAAGEGRGGEGRGQVRWNVPEEDGRGDPRAACRGLPLSHLGKAGLG